MRRPLGPLRILLLPLLMFASILGTGRGATPDHPAGPPPATGDLDGDAARLAERIDTRIAARWAEAKVRPAELSGDEEFLRRVTLDVVGRIPSASEVRAFLEDPAPDKRRRVVERLLQSPGYVNHFTNGWRALLLPEANTEFTIKILEPNFRAWIRARVARGAGYDAIVRELLTAKLGTGPNGFNPFDGQGGPDPLAFYFAKEGKPENLAASTARLFLGVRIECAQCHNHPFARWKREQFWGFASFFGGVQRKGEDCDVGTIREVPDRRELAIPGTERFAQAAFLDGAEPAWRYRVGARETLAAWLTAPENPYFARATANRIWAHFFGIGLVDPVDDFGDDNPPSHPELLDELGHQLAKHRFDVAFLVRAITASRTYQLTSVAAGAAPSQEDPRLYARRTVKGLTPEQLYDSLAQATGLAIEPPDANPFATSEASPRKDILDRFASQDEKPTERQTSILQALTLMNGALVTGATSLEESRTLLAVADAPFLDRGERIEALYLAALGRFPRADERERMVRYVERGGPTGNPRKALADVFWALLNSSEFLLNH